MRQSQRLFLYGGEQVEKLLLTTTEAAAALGIGRTKLYELIGSGHISTVPIGRAVRVPAGDLHRFVDEQRQTAHGAGDQGAA